MFYLEHVAADVHTWTWKLQRFLNPLQRKIADNCHFTRRIWDKLDNFGFEEVSYERFGNKRSFNPLKHFNPVRPMVIGTATK